MKTKIIPFDLETAKKIQAGEIEGKIRTRDGRRMRIVGYDSTVLYCGNKQPIIAQDVDDSLRAYCKNGAFMLENIKHPSDLVIELPDNEPQFKPFDKVLVRNEETDTWHPSLYATTDGLLYYTTDCKNWQLCVPYEGNENLVGTIGKPKEE